MKHATARTTREARRKQAAAQEAIAKQPLARRLFCLIAAVALAFSMMPIAAVSAYADAETTDTSTTQQEQSTSTEGEGGETATSGSDASGQASSEDTQTPAAQQPTQDESSTSEQEGAPQQAEQDGAEQGAATQKGTQEDTAEQQSDDKDSATKESSQDAAKASEQTAPGVEASNSEPVSIVTSFVKGVAAFAAAPLGDAPSYPLTKQVKVTFDAKGGTPVPAEQHLRAGEMAAVPADDPTKTGWEPDPEGWGGGFDGWYTDENYSNKFDFNTPVEDDITLYARWNGRLDVTAYDKTNDAQLAGGTIACENVEESITGQTQYGSSNIAEGTKVTLTATPDTGYRFVRWEKAAPDAPVTVSTDATYEFTFTENPTTLYAVFEVKPLTITLVPTTIDGSKPVENYEVEIMPGESFDDIPGSDYRAACDHFRDAEGYLLYDDEIYLLPDQLTNYSSWDEVDDADEFWTELTEDTTFYVPMSKTVTEIPVSVEEPVCGTETSFEIEGYRVKDPDSATNMPVVTIEGNEVQPYDNDAARYFWWVTEDGIYQDTFTGRFEGGKNYGALLQFETTFGYEIDYDNPPAVTVNGTEARMLTRGSSYIDVVGIVTADHDWDEGVVDPEPTCTEPGVKTSACKHNGEDWHGEDASKTEEVPALGHDWGEWTVVKEPTATEEGLEQRVCARCGEVEERTIPAKGEEPKAEEFTITYDLNGGTFNGSTDNITETYADGTVIKVHAAPTREGYTFLYWKGSEYQPGDEYTVTGDHTFTAQWKKNAEDATPKTGDTMPLVPLALLALFAVGAVVGTRRQMQ